MDTHFDLPIQNLKQLSFCKTNKDSIQQWVKQLPKADMGKTTRLLYLALDELSLLEASPQLRFELVKALHPALELTREGLRSNFLNQPIIMPDHPRQIANLCQALQRRLASVHIVIANDAEKKMSRLFNKPRNILAQAIYAAMDAYLDILIRSYALYRPIEATLWQSIHKLHQLSEQYSLSEQSPTLLDEKNTTSINTLYRCCLLWGGIKANQLRQKDILALKPYVKHWASLVQFTPIEDEQSHGLLVDPETDSPPVYPQFYSGDANDACFMLGTDDLIKELKLYTGQSGPVRPETSIKNTEALTENLINHLILTWGIFTDRTFMRLESNSTLSLCVGLSTTHYYLSDQKTFIDLVYGKSPGSTQYSLAAKFEARRSQAHQASQKKTPGDIWDLNKPSENSAKAKTEVALESIGYHLKAGAQTSMALDGSEKEKYHNYKVDVVNMSPQGYCLEWSDQVPHSIRAGEIIGVKETHQLGWNIGAIRWVKQGDNNDELGLKIGVELLSSSADAFGAYIIDNKGKPQSDFMRVLKLPEIKATNQPATLITPALSFREGQSIILAKDGEEHTVELDELLGSSGSYYLFSYKAQETLAKTSSSVTIEHSLESTQGDGEFDSVWENL